MRIPKYRAWHKGNKEMIDRVTVYPDGVVLGEYGAIFRFDKDEYLFELMEWTGLKDRNSKDIYEADIIRVYNENRIVSFQHAFWGAQSPKEYYKKFGYKELLPAGFGTQMLEGEKPTQRESF